MKENQIVLLDTKTFGEVDNLHLFEKYGKVQAYETTLSELTSSRIKDANIVVTNKVILRKQEIDAAQNLQLICIAATGTNNVDLSYAQSKGIEVKNAKGYSSASVAQSVLASVLFFIHQPQYYHQYVAGGSYSKNDIFTHIGTNFHELNGQRVGIIGLGNIGNTVAGLFSAFDAEVVYYSTTNSDRSEEYQRLSLQELLSTCDIITIHTPLNRATKNLITLSELKMMKPSSVIVNTGRGGIINEYDLAEALDHDLIAGAIIDVYEQEPIPEDHPYLSLKNPDKIVLSPHSSWASVESRTKLIEITANNIAEFLDD